MRTTTTLRRRRRVAFLTSPLACLIFLCTVYLCVVTLIRSNVFDSILSSVAPAKEPIVPEVQDEPPAPPVPKAVIAQLRTESLVRQWVLKRFDSPSLQSSTCRPFFETGPLATLDRPDLPAVPDAKEVPTPTPKLAQAAPLDGSAIHRFSLDRPRGRRYPPRTIFFTSRYDRLPSPLQDDSLCAVEAAARTNPGHQIDIWTLNVTDLEENLLTVFVPASPVDASFPIVGNASNIIDTDFDAQPTLVSLQQDLASHPDTADHFLTRIRLRPISDTGLFVGTPFLSWYTSGRYNQTKWVGQNLSNAIRLAILWAEGGTYLDLDILMLNALPVEAPGVGGRKGLRRALALQDRTIFFTNNAFMTLPPRDPLTWAIMEEFVGDFKGDLWGWQGPLALTRALFKRCPSLARQFRIQPRGWIFPKENPPDPLGVCDDLAILREERFYGVSLPDALTKFPSSASTASGCALLERLRTKGLGLHLWHNHIKRVSGQWPEGSVYKKVVARSCPSVMWWREQEAERLKAQTVGATHQPVRLKLEDHR